MNHLPLDKKFIPKFDNYCAFIDRQTIAKMMNNNNIDKIPEIRK